jgi:hypothetical protein
LGQAAIYGNYQEANQRQTANDKAGDLVSVPHPVCPLSEVGRVAALAFDDRTVHSS